jgi:putative oxidoreductase
MSSRLETFYSPGFPVINGLNDALILAARLLLATLFLIFGWRKVRDYPGTVNQMVELGVPTPVLATVIAIFMELPVAFAIAVGAFTRPAAALMALYALGTALTGHRYWTVKGADYVDSLDGFYKDLSIMGGFLLLCMTGAGRYSIDALFGIAAP